jgi:MSHA biogenesis protein MshJ
MKTAWKSLSRRINALSLRERVIMAGSLAAALLAVVDALVLTPQFEAQRRLLDRLRVQGAELQTLRARLTGPVADTPEARLATQLVTRRAELASLELAIEQRLASGPPAHLDDLLRSALRRHERLTLLKLETLAPSGTAASAAAAPGVRRGVHLQLSGRYADLAAYAGAIERQLPGLRWQDLQIDASQQPPVMSAQLWLVGGGS